MKNINLFCLPFAGGNKYSFTGFKKHCPETVDMHTLDLPGRGTRINEVLLTDIHQMAEDVFTCIKEKTTTPYAIYGHSLGSLLAYLVTRKIVQQDLPPPIRLIVSGRGGPSVNRKDPMRYLLPHDEFTAALREMGGMSEVLENEELMEFFEPILRSDLQAAETYQHVPTEPLDIPITAMYGLDEKVDETEAMAWQKETTFPLELISFPGHHFFIQHHEEEIMGIISRNLLGAAV